MTAVPIDALTHQEVKAYVEHLTHAQYNLIATASEWQDSIIE